MWVQANPPWPFFSQFCLATERGAREHVDCGIYWRAVWICWIKYDSEIGCSANLGLTDTDSGCDASFWRTNYRLEFVVSSRCHTKRDITRWQTITHCLSATRFLLDINSQFSHRFIKRHKVLYLVLRLSVPHL